MVSAGGRAGRRIGSDAPVGLFGPFQRPKAGKYWRREEDRARDPESLSHLARIAIAPRSPTGRLAGLLLLVPSDHLRRAGRDTRLSRTGVARTNPAGFESGRLINTCLLPQDSEARCGPFWLTGRPRCH